MVSIRCLAVGRRTRRECELRLDRDVGVPPSNESCHGIGP